MERELTVLLVEDDQQACAEIAEYIDTLEDVTLVGVTNNSAKAVELICEYLPDAVILDLELHHGSGNGLLMLQQLKQTDLLKMPYILIATNNSSATTFESARLLGADFILSKHQADYSSRTAVDFLRMTSAVILNRGKHTVQPTQAEEAPAVCRSKRLARRISTELDKVGISPKAVGYQYLIDGTLFVMQGATHSVSSLIAGKYGKTDASVERAMQNAISRAWKSQPIEELLTHYTARISSEKGIPTVTEFVFYYANKINNE